MAQYLYKPSITIFNENRIHSMILIELQLLAHIFYLKLFKSYRIKWYIIINSIYHFLSL